jgi:hypothetical protein
MQSCSCSTSRERRTDPGIDPDLTKPYETWCNRAFQGRLRTDMTVGDGELVVFEESSQPIEVEAEAKASFVFGSAVKHAYPLVTGRYAARPRAHLKPAVPMTKSFG